MGLLDRINSPMVEKGTSVAVMAGLFAIFIAMCVTAPADPVSGVGADLTVLNTGDTAWMLVSCALVLIMTPGVAFFYSGMAESKNVVSTIMQAFLPLSIIPIAWSILGFGLAFGESVSGSAGIFGSPADLGGLMYGVGAAPFPALAATIPGTVFFLFQLMFAVITPGLIIGSIADRVNVSALCIFAGLWHLLLYCPLAHMVWHPSGLIRTFGVLDFAGGTVVHMSSGYAALVAAKYLGHSLSSRAKMIGATQMQEPHGQILAWAHSKEPANVPIVVLGTALLWFGWFGFNAGSAAGASAIAGQAFLTTNAATASAMITWLLMDLLRGYKMRATGACVGAVVGLVAITPAAGFVNVGAAFLIGMIGAVVCNGAQLVMERYGKNYVDDTLDVFCCHGIGGTVGMICTSLFASTAVNAAGGNGAFYGNPMLLAKTLLVLVIIVPWFVVFTWGCLWVTDQILSLRVSDEEEMMGLDVSKHGERHMGGMVVVGGDPSVHGSSVHGSAFSLHTLPAATHNNGTGAAGQTGCV